MLQEDQRRKEKLSVTKNVWKGVLELSLARRVRTRQEHQVRKGFFKERDQQVPRPGSAQLCPETPGCW